MLKNFHLFGYPRATWVFSQWRVRGSGPPYPPPYQTWRLYGTETVVNRQDRISIRRVPSAPTATGDHRLRNTWSSPWEVNCHKKSSTVLFEPKFGPPIKNSWILYKRFSSLIAAEARFARRFPQRRWARRNVCRSQAMDPPLFRNYKLS